MLDKIVDFLEELDINTLFDIKYKQLWFEVIFHTLIKNKTGAQLIAFFSVSAAGLDNSQTEVFSGAINFSWCMHFVSSVTFSSFLNIGSAMIWPRTVQLDNGKIWRQKCLFLAANSNRIYYNEWFATTFGFLEFWLGLQTLSANVRYTAWLMEFWRCSWPKEKIASPSSCANGLATNSLYLT